MLPILTHPVIIYYEKEFHPLLNAVMSRLSDQWTTFFPRCKYTLVYFPRFWDRVPWGHPQMSEQFRYYQPEYRMESIENLAGARRMLSAPHFMQVLYKGLNEILDRSDLPEAGFILGGREGVILVKDVTNKEKEALTQEDPLRFLESQLLILLSKMLQSGPYSNFTEILAAEPVMSYCKTRPEVELPDPEEEFERESERVELEIREELELKLGGENPAVVLNLLVHILEHVKKGSPVMAGEIEHLLRKQMESSNRPLSILQLKTTHGGFDYKIILPDYDLEIKMPKLPKALYLLFLRHPEGIFLHDLPDYRIELLEIYRKIASISDQKVLNDNIERLVTMTDNSVHVNCARIKRAFMAKIDERLARHYYVWGNRGERKKVDLPPELIQIDPALL